MKYLLGLYDTDDPIVLESGKFRVTEGGVVLRYDEEGGEIIYWVSPSAWAVIMREDKA